MRHEPSKSPVGLAELRQQIDALDGQLVALLARRQRVVENVIEIKRREKLPARAPARIEEILTRIRQLAAIEKLDPDLAVAVWREMIEQFIALEERVLAQ